MALTEELKRRKRARYAANRDAVLKRQKEWRHSNIEHFRAQARSYYTTPETRKIDLSKPHCPKAYMKMWRAKNSVHVKAYNAHYRRTNIQALLRSRLRARIQKLLKASGVRKGHLTQWLVGCSMFKLREHIESLFKPGMNWFNRSLWHIDHKRPCASFDLTKIEEQLKCFHFSNLEPLWAYENMSKGKKYTPPSASHNEWFTGRPIAEL